MDVYELFEQRANDVFKGLPPTVGSTIPFRKVAKRAVRAMRKGAFVMDGHDAVPALCTVLVSPADYQSMRPACRGISHELELLMASQAEEAGCVLVGPPLARFVADDGVRAGRFAVVADNVDGTTLERLRQDEHGLDGRPAKGRRLPKTGLGTAGGRAGRRRATPAGRR